MTIKWDLFHAFLFLIGDEWPRADQMHVPNEDIEKLRNLVQVSAPKEAPHARKSRIHDFRRSIGIVLMGADGHGSEFIQNENPPAMADAVLSKDDGPTGIEPNSQGNQ